MISIVETSNQRRLVHDGKLVAPWAGELKSACEKARTGLRGRELVVDLKNVTSISQEGENILLELIHEGVKFRCFGVFTKQVVKQLARRTRISLDQTNR